MAPRLVGEVFSLPALWSAARRASRGKRGVASVARYRLDLEGNLLALRSALTTGSWRPSPQREMWVTDGKRRLISVPTFGDRVVHQCLCAELEPRIERRMISDSYACRKNLGSHAALRRATGWARTWRWWVRLDVQRFFPSIDHQIVREQLCRDVPERPLRAVCGWILDAGAASRSGVYVPGDDLFSPIARASGLPIGNLTSQLWANRYLDPIDHFVKDRLRHRGYLRYMDDMLLFHDDRDALVEFAHQVEQACWGLRLRLHRWDVQPTRAGVGFVGYRIMPDHIRVRRSSVARAEERLSQQVPELLLRRDYDGLRVRMGATFAHWSHASSWRLRELLLRKLGLFYRE